MRVLAVTSWGGACGIANYADMLKGAIELSGVELRPDASLLDPIRFQGTDCDVLWLNYHAGLHSQWTPDAIRRKQEDYRTPLVITYHDTYQTNIEQVRQLADLADVFIVHEPVDDIPKARVIRQGIPKPGYRAFNYSLLQHPSQPILGTAGFDFPWKNFTRLAELTAEIGWAFALASHDVTRDRRDALLKINPWTFFLQDERYRQTPFFSTAEMVGFLSSCTATAWMYECANSGTSGAIRLGLAAMRPLYALRSCRQFRDLLHEDAMRDAWVYTWADLETYLVHGSYVHAGVNGGAVALYATDSWEKQAIKYQEAFEAAIEIRQGRG